MTKRYKLTLNRDIKSDNPTVLITNKQIAELTINMTNYGTKAFVLYLEEL